MSFDFERSWFLSYCNLTGESVELIESCSEFMIIPKKTKIVTQGEKNKYVYIIKKGVVRGFHIEDGIERTISLWMDGDTFGDVKTYINNEMPASKSYEALEDLEVYRINTKKFREFFSKSHELCNLGRILVEDFIIKSDFFKDSIAHLTPFERYCFFIKFRPGLVNRIKIKHIASYLQLTPETLSRVRKRCCNSQSCNFAANNIFS